MKNKIQLYVSFTILVMLEQGIKLVIYFRYFDLYTPIIKPWFYFRPVFNRDYSWINSLFQLGLGKVFHVMMVIMILSIAILLYKYMEKEKNITGLINITFIFFFSGAVCSLIDKVFWDGSLDYILLRGYFTFDLKDIYINIFIGLAIWMLISNHNGFRKLDEKDFIKDFCRFLLRRSE